jgi:DNA-binding SARP family transcriptional activator/ABC-type branched-subunit amino acid transport system substrate-binding protein
VASHSSGWEFRVLGPFEVEHGGRELALGGGKQRALLALLLLARGEVVSAERLVDKLWGEAPPAGASKTLQVYVSRLRAALGNGGLIVTRGSGYLLDLEPAAVDAQRFEWLFDRGRELLAGGDARRASQTLVEALALWRGQALSGFEYESWAQPELARLEDLRVAAREERIEADLQLGESTRLVPELEALVAEHPLRERLRAQMMLALYRSGRQAEALEAFNGARRHLVDGLGIEPGRELRELERMILNHDPELGPATRPRPLVRGRGGRRFIVVGALLLAGAAGAAAVGLSHGGPARIAPDALATLNPANGHLAAQVALSSPATDVVAGGGSVWALSGDTGTITQLDAHSGRLLATFAAGVRSVDVGFGGGFVWVLASGTAPSPGQREPATAATISQVDPQSRAIVKTIRLPLETPGLPFFYGHLPGAHLLAWAGGSLWVVGPSGTVFRIDAARGRIAATVPDIAGQGIAAAGDAVWVRLDQPGHATFTRVNVHTNRAGPVLRTPALVLNAPASFAAGGGALWVPDSYTGLLYRVTPGSPPIIRAAPIGVGLTSVAYASGAAWAGDEIHDTLTRVDGTTGRVVAVLSVPSPESLAATSAGVWVGSGPAASHTLPRSSCGPVVYAGSGRPRVLIASDLALQGGATRVNLAMARAVEWTLRRHGFRAGAYSVGYQSCDDSTPQAGTFDFAKCIANAKLYAKTPSVLGVVGTYNSQCTGEALPVLNQAPGGAVPIISPQNTFQLLTRGSPAAAPDALQHFYPTGVRNFLRVTPTDTHEVAADAVLARQLGLHRVLVVADDGTGGSVIHTPEFLHAAGKLGLQTKVFMWRAEQQPASLVVAGARSFGADGIFVSAGYPPRLAQLIRAFRSELGRSFPIIATDYLQGDGGVWQTAGGAEGAGVYTSTFGLLNAQLPRAGQQFLHAFDANTPSFGAAYAAQATEVLLAAISRSDGTRPSVLHRLFETNMRSTILGRVRFTRGGDLVNGPITILRLRRGPSPDGDPAFANTVVDRVITPPAGIVP